MLFKYEIQAVLLWSHSLYSHFCEFVFYEFFWVFSYDPIRYELFLNRSIWPIDGILTGAITPGQSESRIKEYEGILSTSSELDPHY